MKLQCIMITLISLVHMKNTSSLVSFRYDGVCSKLKIYIFCSNVFWFFTIPKLMIVLFFLTRAGALFTKVFVLSCKEKAQLSRFIYVARTERELFCWICFLPPISLLLQYSDLFICEIYANYLQYDKIFLLILNLILALSRKIFFFWCVSAITLSNKKNDPHDYC